MQSHLSLYLQASYARQLIGNFNWGPISRNDIASNLSHALLLDTQASVK